MKRFALILTTITALFVFVTPSADAADNPYWHPHRGYAVHAYTLPVHRPIHRVVHHSYVAPVFGGYGYNRFYDHGGGFRISTPRFGLRIGH